MHEKIKEILRKIQEVGKVISQSSRFWMQTTFLKVNAHFPVVNKLSDYISKEDKKTSGNGQIYKSQEL